MCKSATRSLINRCSVVFSRIPELYSVPVISASTITVGQSGSHVVNIQTFTAEIDDDWLTLMTQAGFHVHAELTPVEDTCREWDLDNNHAQWDDDTQQQYGTDSCTLEYTEDAVIPTPLQFELIAEITIILPTEGDLMSKVKKTVENGKVYYKAAITRYEGLLSALDQPVSFEDGQIGNFQTEEQFTLGPWNSGSASKKKRTGSKLMSTMVLNSNLPVAIKKNPVVRVSEIPQQGGLIRSVRQVLDLGERIDELNEDATVNPQLRIVMPQACELPVSFHNLLLAPSQPKTTI